MKLLRQVSALMSHTSHMRYCIHIPCGRYFISRTSCSFHGIQSTRFYYYWPSQSYHVLAQSSCCKSLSTYRRYSLAYSLAYLQGAYGCGYVCTVNGDASSVPSSGGELFTWEGTVRSLLYCTNNDSTSEIFVMSETRAMSVETGAKR
jgi:hypothetical protein